MARRNARMTSSLIKTLPLAAFLLVAASGCEFVGLDEGIAPPSNDPITGDGGGPMGPAPLYPFKPGGVWQYQITYPDGHKGEKTVTIDAKMRQVGGVGEHQLDMAYAVRTSIDGMPAIVTMQQAVGDKIVNWREQTLDQWGSQVLDVNYEPQQLEVDNSAEKARAGVTWQESYSEQRLVAGGMVSLVKQNETWTVVGQEMLTLPNQPDKTYATLVFQKVVTTGTGPVGDGGMPPAGDAGDAGPGGKPPTIAPSWNQADDAGTLPKTLWYSRGLGKLKEAGGGQATEELIGLQLA
jgi:hypothetical protein